MVIIRISVGRTGKSINILVTVIVGLKFRRELQALPSFQVKRNAASNASSNPSAKYTGQYKKHAAPPSKPLRKTKQQQQQQQQNGSGNTANGGRSVLHFIFIGYPDQGTSIRPILIHQNCHCSLLTLNLLKYQCRSADTERWRKSIIVDND